MESNDLDPFTKNLLERARLRQENLSKKFGHSNVRKRSSPLREDNSQFPDDSTEGKRFCSPEKFSPKTNDKGVSEEVDEETSDETKENQNNFGNKIQKSISTYSKGEIEELTPPPKPPRLYPDLPKLEAETTEVPSVTPLSRRNRLAKLASAYNELEEEFPKKVTTQPSPTKAANHPSNPCFTNRNGSDTKSMPGKRTGDGSTAPSSQQSRQNPSPSSKSSFKSSFNKAREMFQNVRNPPTHTTSSKVGLFSNSTSKCSNSSSQVLQPDQIRFNSTSFPVKTSEYAKKKAVPWDEAVMATLELQGFVKSPSRSKLEYNFKKANGSSEKSVPKAKVSFKDQKPIGQSVEDLKTKQSKNENSKFPVSSTTKHPPPVNAVPAEKKCSVQERILRFENNLNREDKTGNSDTSPEMRKTDPAELPLSARVALFEHATQMEAAAAAAVPRRIPFKAPVQKSVECIPRSPNSKTLSPSKVSRTNSLSPSKVNKPGSSLSPHKVSRTNSSSPSKANKPGSLLSPHKVSRTNSSSPIKVSKPILEKIQSLKDNERKPARVIAMGEFITKSVEEQFQPIPPPPPLPPQPSTSESFESSITESDILESRESSSINNDESTNEDDDEYQDTRNYKENKVSVQAVDEIIDEDEEISDNVSDFLDEALVEEDTTDSQSDSESLPEDSRTRSNLKVSYPRSPVQNLNEETICYKTPQQTTYKSPVKIQQVISYGSENLNDAPLMHSVSFYRRQKQSVNVTPVKTVILTPIRKTEVPTFAQSPVEEISVKDKIKALQEEVCAQQTVISQTSQALNLCRASVEFHGSSEQVEGERLLLIATQKRLSCLNEIQRLKTEGGMGKESPHQSATKGSLTISGVSLPLKREFLLQTDQGKTGEFVHFFLFLVKHKAQVVASQMLCTMDSVTNGALHFANLIKIHDLDFNFNIAFEVYGLQTKRDQISHHKRTLSKKEKSRMNLTPKKFLKQESKSMSMQSPGGPNAVRTSSFAVIGFTQINIKNISRKHWSLEKVPFISPLDGSLNIKIQCTADYRIEQKGFLTMFEDVSGFGAWHRRWFVLTNNYLNYWKYPDDETKKDPIDFIDLRLCITPKVGLVARDICARQHTFMLLTVSSDSEDSSSLTSHSCGKYTATKNLLSADTKEERTIWCDSLNAALHNIRSWDTQALQPLHFPELNL